MKCIVASSSQLHPLQLLALAEPGIPLSDHSCDDLPRPEQAHPATAALPGTNPYRVCEVVGSDGPLHGMLNPCRAMEEFN